MEPHCTLLRKILGRTVIVAVAYLLAFASAGGFRPQREPVALLAAQWPKRSTCVS
jgi:hypothetical protein